MKDKIYEEKEKSNRMTLPLSLENHLIPLTTIELKNLIEIAFLLAEDRTVLIRNRIIEILISCVHKLSKSDFNLISSNLMSKWTNHKSFMFRVSAIHCAALLSLVPGLENFKKIFSDLVKNGIKEKVMNVKLSLIRLVGLINQSLPGLTEGNHQLNILLRFYQDDIEKNVAAVAGLVLNSLEEKNQKE